MPPETFSPEQLREFVIAGHWNLPNVQELLAQFPEILLENGTPDPNWTNHEDKTPLTIATEAGNEAISALLLKYGAA